MGLGFTTGCLYTLLFKEEIWKTKEVNTLGNHEVGLRDEQQILVIGLLTRPPPESRVNLGRP